MQELVESEREYQLCDQGEGGWGVVFSSFPPSCFSSVSQLSSFRSPPGMVCVMAPLSSLFLHCPRETPHMQSRHRAADVGVLSGVSVHLWAPEECLAVCAASCVCAGVHACVCARVQVLGCINTQAF